MRTEVIKADAIDAAAEGILNELKYGTSRENVIYFDGWDGLGASAVLRVVAQRLAVISSEAPAGMTKFDQIIHVDCSKWESRRAVQRAIAEQLKLPASVMDMFDRQDEEDDFNGLAQGSRAEIQQVVTEIYRHTLNQRFVVIFHHGSREDIDLTKLGLPLFGYAGNKMLWTFRGRFRLNLWVEVDKAVESIGVPTDVFFTASRHEQDPHKLWSLLAHQEAAEVARMVIDTSGIVCQPAQVEECLLYMLKICGMTGGHHFINFDLATHSSNYWICDGIIKQQQQGDGDDGDDEAWRAADALQNEMRLGVDCNNKYLSAHLLRGVESMPCWASPGYGLLLIPANGEILQQFNRLGVLKLSHCTFRFSSPPYLSCQSLRFLWLDHCEDQVISTSVVGEMVNQDMHQCFQRLWVLDVRYTSCDWILSASLMDAMTHLRELNVEGAQDWDIGQLQSRLPNIRKLRVTKSTVRCSGHSEQDLFQEMNKMKLLDFSGNRAMKGVTEFSEISTSNNYLETVMIIDGCVGIQKFSFRGCAKLKNLLLSGLFEDLCTLDLSGTAVKTLDLSAMTAKRLDELFLHDCRKLCAILWSPKDKRKSYLKKLHMDTTWSAASSTTTKENSTEGSSTTAGNTSSSSSSSLSVGHGGRAPSEFDWCIRVRDARLLRSLVPLERSIRAHVEIYSPATAFPSGNDNKAASSNSGIKQQHVPLVKMDKPTDSFLYADVEVTLKDHPLLQPSEGDAPMLTQIWPCPSIPSHDDLTCYTHIQDHQLSTKSLTEGEQTMNSIIIPDMICRNAYILHVHDSLSITSIQGPAPTLGSTWYYLEWCRVERCPKLEHVFTAPQLQATGVVIVFYYLQTFWASELSKARYIWNWNPPSVFQFKKESFEDFKLLHMDLCPRVIHVLPLALQMVNGSLRNLETLEIMWCGDLREVFPLYTTDAKSGEQQQQSTTTTVRFNHLKRIHLHELPKLQGICGHWRISAPELETVKIRGCWSLKRLPAVGNNTSKKVECDCEKEWWDTLEWDGLDANHHPSLYKATHSKYYKKTLLKGSVLR